MIIEIEAIEARVLGAFIEKELTTPDYYPLSVNSLTNACNQKSNRDPVLKLSEAEVLATVEELRRKGLAMQSQDAGSRVKKYRHSLRERLYLEDQELAILAELMLRGAQTPGELRSRADRMVSFSDLAQVDAVLQELIDKDPAMVVKLERQAGRKENRYMHLFCGAITETEAVLIQPVEVEAGRKTFADMENELENVKTEIAALKNEFEEFKKLFQ